MSSKTENNDSKRQLGGALAATLGLIALACSDDDSNGPGGAKGGSSGSAGKGSSGAAGTSSSALGGGGAEDGEPGGMAGLGGSGAEDVDVAPLNALLAAEYNAITAYSAGAGLIGTAPDTDPLHALADVITQIAVDIQSHHKLHAAALVDAIEALAGAPVEEQTVADAFVPPQALTDNPSISNVLKFATSAERAAAIAYNQVLAGLEDSRHRFLAASIEGDESQHFIVLAALVLGLADPGPSLSLDTATDVVPQAFVRGVGDEPGLETAPVDYFP